MIFMLLLPSKVMWVHKASFFINNLNSHSKEPIDTAGDILNYTRSHI